MLTDDIMCQEGTAVVPSALYYGENTNFSFWLYKAMVIVYEAFIIHFFFGMYHLPKCETWKLD
jgi:hypothetical protein